MSTTLAGKRIAFLVAPEGAEQVELTEPWKAVQEAGGTPELVSTEVGKIQAFNHLTPADTFEADKAADSVTASEYDGLVLPGGVANPDFLRGNASAVPVHQKLLRLRPTRCGDLPRRVDDDRRRRGARQDDHLVAQRCAPICSMPAPTGSTKRWWCALVGPTPWCPAASPMIFPRSATPWWARSRPVVEGAGADVLKPHP